MRIISKFQDYYDIGLSAGIDKHITYVRTTELVPFQCSGIGPPESASDRIYAIYRSVLGFCGKLYPFVNINHDYKEGQRTQYKLSSPIWSYDEAIAYLDMIKKGSKWERVTKVRPHFADPHNNLKTIFEEHNVPAFLLRGRHRADDHYKDGTKVKHETYKRGRIHNLGDTEVIELNPNLGKLEFYTQVDAWTAFQEISMYVGGVLSNNEDKIPPVSEADRIAGRGFDKFSFRKRKQEKK